MNLRMQTDTWIFRTVIVLSLILVVSVFGILILKIAGRPVPDILIALGAVAMGGLVRLSISPLSRKLSLSSNHAFQPSCNKELPETELEPRS